jgi:hypothetical protein
MFPTLCIQPNVVMSRPQFLCDDKAQLAAIDLSLVIQHVSDGTTGY